MRKRAGVIIYCVQEQKLLLIYRKKQLSEYWVVSGGGVEHGETFEAAARRELFEELRFDVDSMSEFCTIKSTDKEEKYFITFVPKTIELTIHGEEQLRSDENNIYKPQWVDVKDIMQICLQPPEIKAELAKYFSF